MHRPVDDLDQQYAINVRAPYVLSKRLHALLTASRGTDRIHQLECGALGKKT
jgi:hypothetical protein